MTKTEIAELIQNNSMYEIAVRTCHNLDMSEDQSTIASELDEHFKAIGKRGSDPDCEIAAFIQKVINEEVYETPDELLDAIFERGTIGYNDDFENVIDPKNTLVAYEAGKGGNVPRSFLDVSTLTPKWRNRQVETEISYADLKRNGWKTVALMTEYAVAACKNAMFSDIFTDLTTSIVSGDNFIDGNDSSPTAAQMDALALYVNDRADMGDGIIVALSKYIQKASKINGFISDDIVNEVHRNGRLGVYDGVSLYPISGAKKLGNGSNLIPANQMFGIAGKIGVLNMKGETDVYEDFDNNKEKVHILVKNFTYGYAWNNSSIDHVCILDCNA